MSKSTKIIAALGVVAGLGVAALPAFTYAASVDGDAEVIVEVSPAISLAITGNNDEATGFGPFFESDPTGVYTSATGLNTNTSSSKVTMSPNQIVEGQDTASGNTGYGFLSTLTVNTNDKGGYTLNVKAATADDVNLTNANSDTIDALSAAAASFTQGTEGWGIKADDDYSIQEGAQAAIKDDQWYPVTASNQLIRPAVASPTGYANQATKIYYGVSTDAAQPTGTYQSTLTYTATTAN
ncbi:hypothetical protein IKD60_01730 [Candidatus Saccharibacteria bacterium]|nr:hypothetical protein [Candidatus Saccharibacteria bacterium]